MTQATSLPVHQPSLVPQLIYSCKQYKDAYFYSIMVLAMLIMLASTVFVAFFQVWLSVVIMVAVSAISIGVILLATPKRLEVWSDSIRIVFIPGYKWSVSLASVLSVEENPEICSCAPALKFSTAMSRNVLIYRRGLAVQLSPEHPAEFCQHIKYAMAPGSYVLPTKTVPDSL